MKVDRYSFGFRVCWVFCCFFLFFVMSLGVLFLDVLGGVCGDGVCGGLYFIWWQMVWVFGSEVIYQCELDFGGESFFVVEGLDDDDGWCGYGFGQLVGVDGVVLQGEVGEDYEVVEVECQEYEL